MKRARAHAGAARPAKHCRNVRAPAIATLRRIVGQQIETAGNEVDELKLGDWPQAQQRRPARRADNRGFRDGRVDHAFVAKVIDDAFRNFECAAVRADVFADQKDSRVALHLFPDALPYGFDHGGQAATRRAFELVIFLNRSRQWIYFRRLETFRGRPPSPLNVPDRPLASEQRWGTWHSDSHSSLAQMSSADPDHSRC